MTQAGQAGWGTSPAVLFLGCWEPESCSLLTPQFLDLGVTEGPGTLMVKGPQIHATSLAALFFLLGMPRPSPWGCLGQGSVDTEL